MPRRADQTGGDLYREDISIQKTFHLHGTSMTLGSMQQPEINAEGGDMAALGRNRIRYAAMAAGSLLVATSVHAQNGAVAAPAAPTINPDNLGEIVVTAQKRAERLLSVPAPVTAITNATLARQGAFRLADYASLAPGLNLFGTRPGQETITLRGISTGASNSTTTAVYIDDTPVGGSTAQAFDSSGLDVDPGILQRIEVLRGPQGTLYGANALGGILKYVTVAPSLDRYSGRVEIDGSTVDDGGDGWGVHAMANGPIVKDHLGLILSGFARQDPGYIDDPAIDAKHINRTHVYGGRAALEWRPDDKFTFNASLAVQHTHSFGSSEERVDDDLHSYFGGQKQDFLLPTPLTVSAIVASGSAAYDFGWAKLVSITSYERRHRETIGDVTATYGPLIGLPTPPIGLSFSDHPTLRKLTEEVRLASEKSGPFEWQAGFYFTREHSGTTQSVDAFDTTTFAPVDLGLGEPIFFGKITARYTEYAGYADVTYHITPKLSIQGGVRDSANDQYHVFPSTGVLAGGSSTVTGGSSDNSFTFLVTPKFNFDADNMVYARIASGYRPGGPNNGLAAVSDRPTSFRPDTLTNYELGYKASLLNHSLTVDVSAFDIEWKNIQIIETIGGITETGNGASARSYGFEGALGWRPVRGLNLDATLALTHATLTEDAPGVNGRDGDRLPYSPKVEASLSAEYQFPLAQSLDGFFGGTFHYVGNRTSDFQAASPPGYVRPVLRAYHTFDLRAGVDHGGIEIQFLIKNLNDAHGLTNLESTNIDGSSQPLYAGVIQPRTFEVSLISKF